MKNIIITQLYKLRHEKLLIIAFFVILLLSSALNYLMFKLGADCSFGEYCAQNLMVFALMPLLFLFVFTAQISGADFIDKTFNYEIMSGYTRAQVFFGRAAITIALSAVLTLALIIAPLTAGSAFFGWGESINSSHIAARLLLMTLPIIRIICECIMISYIVKNPYIVAGISYLALIIVTSYLPSDNPFLGLSSIKLLCGINVWISYGLDGNINRIYETALSAETVALNAALSLMFIIGSLGIGYCFFKNDDAG